MIDQNTNHMEYQPGMEQIGSEIQDAVISKMNECDFDSYTAADVRQALQKDVLSPEDFAAVSRRRSLFGGNGTPCSAGDAQALRQFGDDVHPIVHCQLLRELLHLLWL